MSAELLEAFDAFFGEAGEGFVAEFAFDLREEFLTEFEDGLAHGLRHFGEFVAEIPAPLAMGSIELNDGRWVKGFVCEAYALTNALDISQFGGWRNYIQSLSNENSQDHAV